MALELFNRMLHQKITPTNGTYGTLMSLSKDIAVVEKLFNEMLVLGIKPNPQSCATLLNVCPDFKTGRDWFERMLTIKIEPNEGLYGSLLRLAKRPWQAKQIFEEMLEKAVPLNVKHYSMLIRSSGNVVLARKYWTHMLNANVAPNTWVLNSLIWIYKDYQHARAVMENEMLTNNILPDVVTYTQLMTISRNFEIAKDLLSEMCSRGIFPSDRTLRVLTALCDHDQSKLDQLASLLSICEKNNFKN